MKFSEFNNKKLGKTFEESLADYLSYKGFWVQLIKQDQDGQSADILAIKGSEAYLIDAKLCCTGLFDINRIEDNQSSSMNKFKQCGNNTGLFAIWIDKQSIYICELDALLEQSRTLNKRYLNESNIEVIGTPLEQWADEIRL